MKNAKNLFQDVGDYFLKISGWLQEVMISQENLWLCKQIRISHVFLNFHINIYAKFHNK